MPNFAELIAVFEEARCLVARPDNDFDWSSWVDGEQAVAEIDGALDRLRRGELPFSGIIFAPTGPMQEVALSSGWGDEFNALADRYDAAMACACFSSPVSAVDAQDLGMDSRFGEVWLLRCSDCGQLWLRYYYVEEAISRSGRWYLGAVGEAISAEDAKVTLEGLAWYFYGGSYYDGRVGKTSGPIA